MSYEVGLYIHGKIDEYSIDALQDTFCYEDCAFLNDIFDGGIAYLDTRKAKDIADALKDIWPDVMEMPYEQALIVFKLLHWAEELPDAIFKVR